MDYQDRLYVYMKNTKNIVITILIVLLVAAGIFLIREVPRNMDRYKLEEYVYGENVFQISTQESSTSFTSPNKVLSLYDQDGNLLDEVLYGDHPLKIESVKGNILTLLIPITFYNRNNVEYINSWLEQNTRVGGYKIEYVVFEDLATSTDAFKYPDN